MSWDDMMTELEGGDGVWGDFPVQSSIERKQYVYECYRGNQSRLFAVKMSAFLKLECQKGRMEERLLTSVVGGAGQQRLRGELVSVQVHSSCGFGRDLASSEYLIIHLTFAQPHADRDTTVCTTSTLQRRYDNHDDHLTNWQRSSKPATPTSCRVLQLHFLYRRFA